MTEGIPDAVLIFLAETIVISVLRGASFSATTSESPFTTSLAVDLDVIADLTVVVVGALLLALSVDPAAGFHVPGVVLEGFAAELILGIVGAPVGDASLVEGPPFASNIVSTGDDVGPSALSADALEFGDVPDANGIGVADTFFVDLAAARSTGSSLGSPFAIGISIAGTVGTPAEEAAINASLLVSSELTLISIFKADVGGEEVALLAALAELSDPSASLAGVAGSGVNVDGTRGVAELLGVVPHAEGVVVARITSCFSKLTSLNAAVERSLEAGVVVDADVAGEDIALSLALSELGVPLTLAQIALGDVESSRADVESARAARSFNTRRSGVAR